MPKFSSKLARTRFVKKLIAPGKDPKHCIDGLAWQIPLNREEVRRVLA